MRKRQHKNYVNLNKLRGVLAEKKITYVECAEAIGISKFQFSRKMNGETMFWMNETIDLANFLRLTLEEYYTIFLGKSELV